MSAARRRWTVRAIRQTAITKTTMSNNTAPSRIFAITREPPVG
jgi:hypothetical protein